MIGEFLVRVKSVGMKPVTRDIDAMGAAVDKATVASDRGTKASKDFYNTQAKGVIGTANSTKSFSKLRETIGGGGGGLVGAYATLAANVFAVTAAFNALRSAAQVEQITRGLEELGNRTGKNLSLAAQSVKEISGYTLSTEQSLRSTAQVMAAGFGRQELERIAAVSLDVSVALGRNMTDSMDRLTRGVIKLEPELLDELGIMTRIQEATNIYAQQTGKAAGALSVAEKRQAFLNAVLAEGEAKFDGLADAAGDTLKYDKLAAKFSDLTKETMRWADSIIALPLGILSSNMGTLLGAAILFASTLKSQLLPGFMNMSKGAEQAAAGIQQAALSKAGGIQLYDKHHDASQWAKSVQEGTAAAGDWKRAVIQVQTDIEKYDASIAKAEAAQNKAEASGKKLSKAKTEELEGWRKNREELVKMRTGLNQFGDASLRAGAQARSGYAIQLAAQQGFRAGWSELKGSIRDFSNSAAEGEKPVSRLSTATFAAGRGMQFFAAASLRAIPIIGQLVLLFGLLKAAVDWISSSMKPAGYEEYTKAMKGLNETLAKSEAYGAAHAKALDANTTAAVRTTQSLTILSNSLSESLELMEEAIRLREHMNEPVRKENWIDSIVGAISEGGPELKRFSNYWFGLKKGPTDLSMFKELGAGVTNTAEMQQFMKMANSPILEERRALKRAMDEEGLTLSDLLTMGRKDEAAMRAKVVQLVKSAGEPLAALTPELEGIKSAFDALDKAYTEFSRSSIPTTKWDTVEEGTFMASQQVTSLAQKLEQAHLPAEELGKLLSQLGEIAGSYMSPSIMLAQKELIKLDEAIKKIKDQGPVTGQNWVKVHNLEIERKDVATNLARIIEEETKKQAEITWQLREQTVLMDGQIKRQQAINSGLSDMRAKNGQGLLEQYEAEEKIRDLQVQKLQMEIKFNKQYVDSLNIQLAQLDVDRKRNAQKAIEARTLALITELDTNRAKALKHIQDGGTVSGMDQYLANWQQRFDAALRKGITDAQQQDLQFQINREALTRQINMQLLGQKSMYQEIQSIAEQNLSTEQKIANARKKDYEISQDFIKLQQEHAQLLHSVAQAQRKIGDIINGSNNSLAARIRDQKISNNLTRENLAVEHANRVEGILRNQEIAIAQRNRAIARGEEHKSADLTIEQGKTELDNQRQMFESKVEELNITEMLATLEAVVFDTRKEGLEWQKESLSYREKELDLTNELYTSIVKNYQLREKNALARSNIPQSEGLGRAQEIDARLEAYRIAVSEMEIREQVIDLEYALLDAQKQLLLFELSERRHQLLLLKTPESGEHIRQLDVILNAIATSPTGQALAAMEKQTRRVNLDNQFQELQGLTIRGNSVVTQNSKLVGEVYGYIREIGSRQRAEQYAPTFTARDSGVKTVTEGLTNVLGITVPKMNDKLIKPLQEIYTIEQQFLQSIDSNVAILANNAAGQVNSAVTGSQKEAMDFFTGKGWSAAQAAGIVGNLMQESQLNSRAHNQEENAQGIAQWRNERITKFRERFGKNILEASFREQLEYIDWELRNTEKRAGDLLKSATTVDAATRVVDKHYERSKGEHLTERLNYARPLVSGGGTTTPTGTEPGTTTDTGQTPTPTAEAIKLTEQQKLAIDVRTQAELNWARTHAGTSKQTNHSLVLTAKGFIAIGDAMSNLPPPPDFSKMQPPPLSIIDRFNIISMAVRDFTEQLTALNVPGTGPLAAFANGFAQTGLKAAEAMEAVQFAFNVANSEFTTAEQKITANVQAIQAGISAAQSAISTVSGVLQAAADAKVSAIDREIAAEQKRDGKSADSVAKIQSLERKKEAIAKKQFNIQKKLQMAQVVMSTASAVAGAYALPPVPGAPWNIALAAMFAALGAAQLAIISGTSYNGGGSASSNAGAQMPETLRIGKRGDTVDLAKSNPNAGGEIGYLRGAQGQGNNASNYAVIGSAYGGPIPRGYGNTAFSVGEQGPEIIQPMVPMQVRKADNDTKAVQTPGPVHFNIQALDAKGVEEILLNQRGNLIGMLREAANANGEPFLEDVNVNIYTKPNVSRL